jgi:hypothetical protein
MNMSNKAKTEETKRDSELMLDELEAVSGGLTYTMSDAVVSSHPLSGHGGERPSEASIF